MIKRAYHKACQKVVLDFGRILSRYFATLIYEQLVYSGCINMEDSGNSSQDYSSYPYMDMDLDLETRVVDLLSRLTLDEKFDLLSGGTSWSTKPVQRLGIKSMFMTDGPHGIGPHSSGEKKCTYFPVGMCRVSTWNPSLSRMFGEALGREVRDIGYHVILGPGVNIIRTPMCGRNFEYQSEDPYLNSQMVVPVIKGIQSQRIAACVKHYCCNNQETWRHWVNVNVTERALREIYLPAFRSAVEEADVWSVMCCYNRVNGLFGSEHEKLVRETLFNDWGFRGFYISDWGATNFTESPSRCIAAGLSLEMPQTNRYDRAWLHRELEAGNFTLSQLDDNVKRLLRVMFLVGLFDDPATLPRGSRNTAEHQSIARKIAEEGIVLLKNQGDLLPLGVSRVKTIAVVGRNADKKMAEGGGSSNIRPPYEITPLEGIKEKCGDRVRIVDDPADADVTIAVVGLGHNAGMDSEGHDRNQFAMPREDVNLILDVAGKTTNLIVVLINGSAVDMYPWIDRVPVVVEAWYAGMEGGRAIANIIFGDVNPSGKLPVTFPKKLDDLAVHGSKKTYPGIDDEDEGPQVWYEEGIFVGYRDLEKRNIE
ncbi:MAG: glycoside hydrolase family 3 C-terminal domain-containing protein, partial [Promethearchaeota archaeon]